MKRLAGLSALALIISSTSGCGWIWGPEGYFRDRGSDYLQAQQTAPMQLPSDVSTSKRLDPLLPIPRNVADDTVKGEYIVPRPQPLGSVADASDYTLQKSGDARWVMAQHAPAEVWPVAMQFFQDNGFRIDEQRPQTGEFTTAWQRSDELSASMAKRLGSVGSADNETRVRVRIEPGVQRNTSEVYVVSAERPVGSTSSVDFTNRSVNTSLDAALVDEMLASMSRSAEKGGSVSCWPRVISIPLAVSASPKTAAATWCSTLAKTSTVPGRASAAPWNRASGGLRTSTAAWACTTSTWRKKPRRKTTSRASSASCSAARRPRKKSKPAPSVIRFA